MKIDFKRLQKDKKYARQQYENLDSSFYNKTKNIEKKIFGDNVLTQDLDKINYKDLTKQTVNGADKFCEELSIPLTSVGILAGVYFFNQAINGNINDSIVYNAKATVATFFPGLAGVVYYNLIKPLIKGNKNDKTF